MSTWTSGLLKSTFAVATAGVTFLTGLSPAMADDTYKFPATGQTTCYGFDESGEDVPIPCAGTGQDGEIQAGARLRFRDERNGTIRDRNTGLTWEKKSDEEAVDDGDNTTFPHDKDNTYAWDDAFAAHVATLNTICANDENVTCATNADCVTAGVGGKCGFAGKRDWRVPNFKELQSIINYENFEPAVSAAFNRRCVAGVTVLTGSCTVVGAADSVAGSDYWSSTTDALDPSRAWAVGFDDGSGPDDLKSDTFHVRAVRGGL